MCDHIHRKDSQRKLDVIKWTWKRERRRWRKAGGRTGRQQPPQSGKTAAGTETPLCCITSHFTVNSFQQVIWSSRGKKHTKQSVQFDTRHLTFPYSSGENLKNIVYIYLSIEIKTAGNVGGTVSQLLAKRVGFPGLDLGVCMFSLCLLGSPLVLLFSSRSPKTCIANWRLGVRPRCEWLFFSMWPYDDLVTYPGCHRAFARWLLALLPASEIQISKIQNKTTQKKNKKQPTNFVFPLKLRQ